MPTQIPDNDVGYVDGETILGSGRLEKPFRVAPSLAVQVVHDESLTGTGNNADPLMVALAGSPSLVLVPSVPEARASAGYRLPAVLEDPQTFGLYIDAVDNGTAGNGWTLNLLDDGLGPGTFMDGDNAEFHYEPGVTTIEDFIALASSALRFTINYGMHPGGNTTMGIFSGASVLLTLAGGVDSAASYITVVGWSSPQVFRYVCNGTEGAQFPVMLPAARDSANYNVQVSSGGPLGNAFKQPRALAATFAVDQFDVELAAAAEAGDVLMFTVEALP